MRGLIDDHEQARLVDHWFAVRWKFLGATVAALSGIAILGASVIELIKAL